MAKKSFSRREFLQTSVASSAALALGSAATGCASIDRFFMGDIRNLDSEVTILGAGAAGLAAAYSLKKRGIPFRIFEGSSRIGGRVQTVRMFPEGEPVAELGAEFFESNHKLVMDLAKEFSLPVTEIKSMPLLEPHLFYINDKVYKVKDLISKMNTLQAPIRRVRADLFRNQDVTLTYANSLQFERSKYYDSISLKDLLQTWDHEVDPVILKLISLQAVSRFGLDAHEQSALNFLATLDAEGSSLMAGRPTYRMQFGLSSLTQALYERVAGVIPNQVVKTEHRLEKITTSALQGFKLTFQTPKGQEVFTTKHIICALPLTALQKIKGIDELDFSPRKKEMISEVSYGTHSKGVLAYDSPFWKNPSGGGRGNLGNYTGEFVSQKFWDSSRGQGGQKALITFMRAGSDAAKMGAGGTEDAVTDLKIFNKDSGERNLLASELANWKLRKGFEGSMIAYKPGQYTRFRGVAVEPEYSGKFLFAGEHTSLRFAGTLQGALESGYQAAADIAEKMS